MHRGDQGPSGPQDNREDMERMAGATGSGSTTGATSTGMQGTTATYSQGRAPERSADYGPSGYGRPEASRTGAALAILAGALAFLQGLAFVIRSHFYPIVPGYAYRWTLHGWGWVILVLGALLFAGGVSAYLGIKGSRRFAAAMAIITAVVTFLVIFYSVVWSIVVVAACAFAAYNLLNDHSRDERYAADADAMGYRGQTYEGMSQGDQRQEAMSHGGQSRRM